MGPAAAGGRRVDADGQRVDADSRRARTDGGRDEPGFQRSLHLLGRKTGDLQGPFKVSLDGGAYKLKRVKGCFAFAIGECGGFAISLKRMANVFLKIANLSMMKFCKLLSSFIIE